MIISLTTSFPTFSFRALISPSLTIIISFLTTAEVKETKSLLKKLITPKRLVVEKLRFVERISWQSQEIPPPHLLINTDNSKFFK